MLTIKTKRNMKYLHKISLLLSIFAVGLFASCDTDNEGAIYESSTNGVSFIASAMQSVEVTPSNPTFTVDLFRNTTEAAASGTLTVDAVIGTTALSGVTVSNYSFNAGEAKTSVTVDVTPLEIGDVLNVTLTINENEVSVGGVASTTIKVIKSYIWTSLGTGTFVDNFFGMTSEPEILKAEGFDRYRVMAPCEAYRLDPANAGDTWIASSSAPYIEFWVEDGLVFWDAWFTGQNYDGDSKSPIYAYHMSDGFSDDPADWTHSKFLDAKTVQLAPYYYINGLGGWNYTQYDGVVIITLP